MNLVLRLMLLAALTGVFTVCTLAIFFKQHRFRWVHQYSEDFLALFGIQPQYAPEIRYTASWLIGTSLAVVVFVLIINVSDAVFLLTGLSGIPLDFVAVPLVVGGIITSLILIAVAFLPAFVMPAVWPTALGIFGLLQLYSLYLAETLLGQVSAFLFFAATAIGFVAVFLSLYLAIRNYIGPALYQRLKEPSQEPQRGS